MGAQTQCGTPIYSSPEVWNGKGYSFACDVYSLGCVTYEMIMLSPPFDPNTAHEEILRQMQVDQTYRPLKHKYSKMWDIIIKLMLHPVETYRPTTHSLLSDYSGQIARMRD